MAHNEQVYTPIDIVNKVLYACDYVMSENILYKHIIDNSCGDGAFLVEIVKRYINCGIEYGLTKEQLTWHLGYYIHGIEIDTNAYNECIKNVYSVLEQFSDHIILNNVKLDIRNADTLDICEEYYGDMDYVVGNPPYCKIQHLDENTRNKVRKLNWCEDGNTDLYIAFFEIGNRMLTPFRGKLCYITPSSWLTSKSGAKMRQHLYWTEKLSKIVSFGPKKVFDKATTFTCITCIDNEAEGFLVYTEDFGKHKTSVTRAHNSFCRDDEYKIYLSGDKICDDFMKVLNYNGHEYVNVKNGYATLNDRLFISKDYDIKRCDGVNVIPMVKATTGETNVGVFPYDRNGNQIEYKDLTNDATSFLEERYEKQSEKLKDKKDWWKYGRTQALKDTFGEDKIAINNIINADTKTFVKFAEKGYGVYGGLYIVANDGPSFDFTEEYINNLLNNNNFFEYVKLLGKFKNGDYYTFNALDVKKFLNYYIGKTEYYEN